MLLTGLYPHQAGIGYMVNNLGRRPYQSYNLPWANASNAPFRLYKHRVHEGGIATPMIAYWPRTIAGASINHAPIHVTDLMATCLDVAGVPYPKAYGGHAIQPLEGESFYSALRGEV